MLINYTRNYRITLCGTGHQMPAKTSDDVTQVVLNDVIGCRVVCGRDSTLRRVPWSIVAMLVCGLLISTSNSIHYKTCLI